MIVENGDLCNQAADQRLVKLRDGGRLILDEILQALSAFLPTNKDRQEFAKTSYKRIVISSERIYYNTEFLYTKNRRGL